MKEAKEENINEEKIMKEISYMTEIVTKKYNKY